MSNHVESAVDRAERAGSLIAQAEKALDKSPPDARGDGLAALAIAEAVLSVGQRMAASLELETKRLEGLRKGEFALDDLDDEIKAELARLLIRDLSEAELRSLLEAAGANLPDTSEATPVDPELDPEDNGTR